MPVIFWLTSNCINKKIAAKFQADDFRISLAVSPVVTQAVKKTMRSDMMLFIRLAVLVIAISLFFMFRRLSAVVYPLIVVGLALISTLALMALLGVAIKMPTMILPSFILAVGVGDSVHVLAIFFQNLKKIFFQIGNYFPIGKFSIFGARASPDVF